MAFPRENLGEQVWVVMTSQTPTTLDLGVSALVLLDNDKPTSHDTIRSIGANALGLMWRNDRQSLLLVSECGPFNRFRSIDLFLQVWWIVRMV